MTHIYKLKDNEIFVFGSNLSGRHGLGAAKTAMSFGAIYGQAEGLQGKTYGIPTKDETCKVSLPLEEIQKYVDNFIQFARENSNLTFLVTKIGCGLAKYEAKDIAPLFKNSIHMSNIILPIEFINILNSHKSLKLSHSAVNRYNTCQKEYKLYYLDKLRPTTMSSPLLFGSAIDKACEDYLLNKTPLRARQIFKDTWKEQEYNGKLIDLQASTEIDYLSADFDHELFSEPHYKPILEGTSFTNIRTLFESLTAKQDKTEEDRQRLAYANWMSLYIKGSYLVNKFIEWVDQYVDEVISCQEVISLEDEHGNQVTGKADFVIKFKGKEGLYVVDLKTTTKYYDRNSVKDSDQLALYVFALREKYPNIAGAAYIVLHKGIKKNRQKICKVCGHDDSGSNYKTCSAVVNGKRCGGGYEYAIFPEAVSQFIVDNISEDKVQSVVEGFNVAQEKINGGVFEANLDACVRYNGKVKCPYFEYCRSGSMVGLIKK